MTCVTHCNVAERVDAELDTGLFDARAGLVNSWLQREVDDPLDGDENVQLRGHVQLF